MNRKFTLFILLILVYNFSACSSGRKTSTESCEPAVIDHSRLLHYIDENRSEQSVKTIEDWQKRRKQILIGMQAVMGPLPTRSNLPPLDVKTIETIKRDGFTSLRLNFLADTNERVPAYLLLPDSPKNHRLPAILALQQTAEIGKDEPAGLRGQPNLHYGLELAKRGYIVIIPDYPPFGEYAGYNFETDRYVSGTMKGIFNHIRCIDLLQQRPDVDPNRIGVIGHSLGGHNAMFLAAFDTRLKVTVSSCGWTPFQDYYIGEKATKLFGGTIGAWAQDRYMPLIRENYNNDPNLMPFDFYEVIAAIAPRAFFSNSPLNDSNFDVNGVKKAISEAEKVYKLFGAADKLQARYPDSEHDFPPDMREQAYQFIDEVLSHNNSGN